MKHCLPVCHRAVVTGRERLTCLELPSCSHAICVAVPTQLSGWSLIPTEGTSADDRVLRPYTELWKGSPVIWQHLHCMPVWKPDGNAQPMMQAELSKYTDWVALGSVDMETFVDTQLHDVADWELNLKMLKVWKAACLSSAVERLARQQWAAYQCCDRDAALSGSMAVALIQPGRGRCMTSLRPIPQRDTVSQAVRLGQLSLLLWGDKWLHLSDQ